MFMQIPMPINTIKKQMLTKNLLHLVNIITDILLWISRIFLHFCTFKFPIDADKFLSLLISIAVNIWFLAKQIVIKFSTKYFLSA